MMRRGPWYQFGDRSQRMVMEQLDNGGAGVGVVISPRDLSPARAIEYATEYRDRGAHVLIDPQFHVPDSAVGKVDQHDIARFRQSISTLGQISDQDLAALGNTLREQHADLGAHGVIAPAVVYAAGRPDIAALNARLFEAARAAADELSIPAYATVVLGRSTTASDATMNTTLAHATAINCDGWYFGFEFDEPRIPTDPHRIRRCLEVGLRLACTGHPVLHAFAGPMALLSLGMGATAAGIGHSQNVWQFTIDRWQPSDGQGGGGDAPPRFFSRSLWGTIIYADEIALLPRNLRQQVVAHSPYSTTVATSPPYTPWNRWDSNKHLLHIICEVVGEIAQHKNPRECAAIAMEILDNAIALHADINDEGIDLADDTASYQHIWRATLQTVLQHRANDYDYFDLL